LSDHQGRVTTEILAACRAGDRDAFRTLYGMHKDRVYSIALYFFRGDPSSAADVTQQVFLKLIANIHQFRGDSEFSTWLYRLVVNTCLDEARHRKPAAELSASVAETMAGNMAQPARQEDEYHRSETARSVQEAVAALPEQFRIAVLLRYFEDLSYEQMAQALDCSMGTVASRLNRGHRMLAERLKEFRGKL
jgi:RNA polymerase sigma-70 factor (ECF subfamily)